MTDVYSTEPNLASWCATFGPPTWLGISRLSVQTKPAAATDEEGMLMTPDNEPLDQHDPDTPENRPPRGTDPDGDMDPRETDPVADDPDLPDNAETDPPI